MRVGRPQIALATLLALHGLVVSCSGDRSTPTPSGSDGPAADRGADVRANDAADAAAPVATDGAANDVQAPDVAGDGPAADGAGTCLAPVAGNLIQNGTFDSSVMGWDFGGTPMWTADEDASQCPTSGAMALQGLPQQCVKVPTSGAYTLRVRLRSNGARVGCFTLQFAQADCAGAPRPTSLPPLETTSSTWAALERTEGGRRFDAPKPESAVLREWLRRHGLVDGPVARQRWLLGAILLVGLALRLAPLTWGLPTSPHDDYYHPDETKVSRGMLDFPGNYLTNREFRYGSVVQYTQGLLLLPVKLVMTSSPTLESHYRRTAVLLARLSNIARA